MKNKKNLFIIFSLLLIGAFFAAIKLYNNYQAERLDFLSQKNSELFIRDYSPLYGDKNAKVLITEFLDPECESCRAVYPYVKQLLNAHRGKVKLVVRYAAFHKNSKIAIRALEASRKQNRYWESLELLFKYQPKWGDHHNPQPSLIFEFLPQAGLNIEQLRRDMEDPQIEKIIKQDQEDLQKLNIRATPTFFVNGKPLEAFGLQYLRQAVEEELSKHY